MFAYDLKTRIKRQTHFDWKKNYFSNPGMHQRLVALFVINLNVFEYL